MFKVTRWPYLMRFEPVRARKLILGAYRRKKGNAVQAAQALGMSHRSLTRAVGVLGLAQDVEALRLELGHPWTKAPAEAPIL